MGIPGIPSGNSRNSRPVLRTWEFQVTTYAARPVHVKNLNTTSRSFLSVFITLYTSWVWTGAILDLPGGFAAVRNEKLTW